MMTKKKWTMLAVTLLMIGGVMFALAPMRSHQKLGLPGVKTSPLTDSENLQVLLPASVPGFSSKAVEQPEKVLNMLPPDTSFGQRIYISDDNQFGSSANVVLMKGDRTSIHKPQICLTGQGWTIDGAGAKYETVSMHQPVPYDLKVTRIMATKQVTIQGNSVALRGIFVYWYVADNTLLADSSGYHLLWSTLSSLATTGVSPRWAYISFFSQCLPGQEEATFERMKHLIVKSVPEFQLPPQSGQQTVSLR